MKTPTQPARDAAADLYAQHGNFGYVRDPETMRTGLWDDHSFVIAFQRAIDEAAKGGRAKLRNIISHASGGHLSEPGDIDRSVNDICVAISRHHNRLWQGGIEKGLKDAAPPSAIHGEKS